MDHADVLTHWLTEHLGRPVQLLTRERAVVAGTLRQFDGQSVLVANDQGQLSVARISDFWLFNEGSSVIAAKQVPGNGRRLD